MSGQKKLDRATKNIRVVTMPTKKRKDYVLDENGQQVYDPKTKEPLVKETQLYKVIPMR